jgi:hypothetical protein
MTAKDARIEDLFQKTLSLPQLQAEFGALSSLMDEINGLFRDSSTAQLTLQPSLIRHDAGFCYVFHFRTRIGRFYTRLPVFARSAIVESGVSLPQRNAMHSDVRSHGGGRYSLWRDGVFFSATDNSDPRINGRTYTLLVPAIVFLMESVNKESISNMRL